jgi:hypothetical protein
MVLAYHGRDPVIRNKNVSMSTIWRRLGPDSATSDWIRDSHRPLLVTFSHFTVVSVVLDLTGLPSNTLPYLSQEREDAEQLKVEIQQIAQSQTSRRGKTQSN